MNIITPLMPVAATALKTVVHGIGEILERGSAFTDYLNGNQGSVETDLNAANGPPPSSGLGQQVHRAALQQQYEQLREEVQGRLTQRFAEQGIELTEPVVLVPDAQGRVLEAGNHWDRAAIEGLLESDAELRSQVLQLLDQGISLWGSGPSGTEGRDSGRPQLVVSESEVFFQVG